MMISIDRVNGKHARTFALLLMAACVLLGSACGLKVLHPIDPESTVYFSEPPRLTGSFAASFSHSLSVNMPAVVYYVSVPAGSPAPTAGEITKGLASGGARPSAAGSYWVEPSGTTGGAVVPSLSASFDVYIAAEPRSGLKEILTAPYRVSGTTLSSYTFQTQWGEAGTGQKQFTTPQGVFADRLGVIHVCDTGNNRIQQFDADGNLIGIRGASGSGNGEFNGPYGICQDAAGNYYVADDGNDRVQKFDPHWNYLLQFGSTGSGDGLFNAPVGVCADNAGGIYVADYANNHVQKFNSSGQFVRRWGSFGGGDGQFINPRGICADRDGYVYVADEGNDRIQKFDGNGNFITKWGANGSGDGQFGGPQSVFSDAAGNIYVIDLNDSVQKFDSSGQFLARFGSGDFANSRALTVDVQGRVYVADTLNNRVRRYR